MSQWRDGIGDEGSEGEDGFLGGGPLETSGSGGEDSWGGEYEEVLDVRGNEKDADVI